MRLNEAVYRSEAAANAHNEGLAALLRGYGRIYFDPLEAVEVYTRQCALELTHGTSPPWPRLSPTVA